MGHENGSKHPACGDNACAICGSRMKKVNLGLSEMDFEELVDRGIFEPVGDGEDFVCDIEFVTFLQAEARHKHGRGKVK